MSAGNGFALDEYVTPRCGQAVVVTGGTMPKGPNEVGSCFQAIYKAAKVPGPEHYNKDHLGRSFASYARGGGFSKLGRDWGKSVAKAPSVGQYETDCQMTKRRIGGGMMSKRERGCQFLDMAMNHTKSTPSPGKYDGVMQEKRVAVPNFTSSKTESRNPSKVSQVGPGYYNMDRSAVEKSSISYTGSKEPMKSYFERISASKAKMPAPGHNGIPESKVEDRGGRKKHTIKLLGDRMVQQRSQRNTGPTRIMSARGAREPSLMPSLGPGEAAPSEAPSGSLSAR